jgi:hypothetical protein
MTGSLMVAGGAQADVPTNTSPPTISGTYGVANQLTDSPVGVWNPATVIVAYQWYDCLTASSCTPATGSGNNTATYTMNASDAGYGIEVEETATDGTTAVPNTATASSALLLPLVPTNQSPPTITSSGSTLTDNHGTWSNGPLAYTYQWQSCSGSPLVCSDIAGATSETYAVPATSSGLAYDVEEMALNAGGSSAAATSAIFLPAAPANTSAPTITGTDATGNTLTESHGAWTNGPTGYTYQWLSCTGSPLTCTAISGATAQTFAIPTTDAGLAFEVQETASNVGATSAAATSAAILPAAPVNTVLPAITGTVALGQDLTASTGTWTNGPYAYAYQWERCSGSPLACTAIAGATASTYTLTSADAGVTIEVEVTATNPGGSTPITSAGSALTAPPALRGSPGITGTTEEGQTLTEKAAVWSNSPTSITWQWYRCDSAANNCVAILEATAQTYVLSSADIGATIQVWETATNAGGSATAFSPFTASVTNAVGITPVPSGTSPPAISGSTQQGATLVESHGAWNGNPGTFSYQWLRCRAGGCSAVPGATGQTYALGPDDVGFSLEVQEAASNGGGTGTTVTSAPTAVVTATSTTALVAPQSSVTNQTVTLVATVTASSGNATASGSVSFRTASGAISGCDGVQTNASDQTATVTCQTSFGTGIVKATAVFAADSGSLVTGSSSEASTISVGAAATVTRLTIPGQARAGSNTRYTASVAPNSIPAGPIRPSGTLTFLDRGKPIRGCSGRRVVNGGATCQVRYAVSGTHRITAHYSGDANFAASTSSVGRITVGRPAPTFITAVMQWYVHYSPTYTSFASWLAYGVAPGSSIYVTCGGTGCPFSTHTLTIAKSAHCTNRVKRNRCSGDRTVNLEPIFGAARLAVGTTVTVSILRCGWYGKHYTLRIRPRRGPSSVISNLPVGVTRPGLKC